MREQRKIVRETQVRDDYIDQFMNGCTSTELPQRTQRRVDKRVVRGDLVLPRRHAESVSKVLATRRAPNYGRREVHLHTEARSQQTGLTVGNLDPAPFSSG